jgi:hypothetical protein
MVTFSWVHHLIVGSSIFSAGGLRFQVGRLFAAARHSFEGKI